jgi:dTDP-4-amino-4,6-dideoxygalactose transaminase
MARRILRSHGKKATVRPKRIFESAIIQNLLFLGILMTAQQSTIEKIIRNCRLEAPVYVTSPRMPELGDYVKKIESIWKNRWLTNNGPIHVEFENKLARYLGVNYLNLFINGTISLLVALKSLDISEGEVITTPFTFPATVHVLWWNRLTPVFCDIEDKTCNIDPAKIEGLITPRTKAILPVHVYGNPCDVIAIEEIARKHNLKVIYDAAHAFGVKLHGKSILEYGDISSLSFHATKLFSTIEGGALISQSEDIKKKIYYLKNFGIADEETVIGPGINGKMNEFQAAFGLLELELVEEEIRQRKNLTEIYRRGLREIPGIHCFEDLPGVSHNYSYFPVLIDEQVYGKNRDQLADLLKLCNIFPRKYFYPLCSSYSCYRDLPSAQFKRLPVANHIVKQVLCLPIYGELDVSIVQTICNIIRDAAQ